VADREYVLGTHDEEIERLGLQHEVWKPRVLAAWRRAGVRAGQTVLDVGCGPGHASLDLAAIVGPGGRVVAVDQSRRFIDHLEARARARDALNIDTCQRDLDCDALPRLEADAAWCRWIFAFVTQPRALLARLADALTRDGAFVIHEYYDYGAWRLLPPSAELEEFVSAVMASWRAEGGDPDVGRWLPAWLTDLGFDVTSARAHVELARPGDPMWQWPAAFLRGGLARLVSLGCLPQIRADAIRRAFDAAERQPAVRMCTPAVIEIVARRTGSRS
jgi:SAM-dependent methyltransferase